MHVDRLSSVLWLCAHAVATCVILVCYSSWVWPRHQLGYAESHDAARLEPSSTSPGRVIGSALGASPRLEYRMNTAALHHSHRWSAQAPCGRVGGAAARPEMAPRVIARLSGLPKEPVSGLVELS